MEWISVNERLPEFGERVIALAQYLVEDGFEYSICDTELTAIEWENEDTEEMEIFFVFDGFRHEPITHWMKFIIPEQLETLKG